MKKLILLALAAVGVGVLVKNKSEQLKAGAAKVTSDPRVQSALATASEKAAPIREKAAPYAEAAKAKAGPVAETVRSKAGPYADTVKEKAGPYAATVKDKVTTAAGAAAGAAGSRFQKTPDAAASTDAATDATAAPAETAAGTPAEPAAETPAETPVDVEAAPEAEPVESSSTSEYGGYPPAAEPTAPVTGDPLTDPIPATEEPYTEQTDWSAPAYDDTDDSTRIVPGPPAPPADSWFEQNGSGITSADSAPGLTEYAPEPIAGEETKDPDTRSFRL